MRLKHRLGWLERAPERSIWFIARDARDLETAGRIAGLIGEQFGRLAFFVTLLDSAPAPIAHPLLQPAPFPLAFSPCLRLAISQLRTRVVILPKHPCHRTASLTQAAGAMGLTALEIPKTDANHTAFIADIRTRLRANPRNECQSPWTERVMRRAYRRGLPFHVERMFWRILRTPETLAARLGHPQTILCLGSGPSSNAPAAIAAAKLADVTFRVKHRWLKEGLIKHADVSFSGTPETARRLPGAIILAQDERTAFRLAMARATPWRRLTFGIVEDLAPGFQATQPDGARMTNGAAMLATAVAMRPAKLIIAGIDLYSHTDGAYPNAPDTANAYAPAHDPAAERAFTLAMIQRQIAQSGIGSVDLIGPLADIAASAGDIDAPGDTKGKALA